ncbi:MAG: 30S ribosomal protein S24e, partial [Thermoplasmata archaeon]|nr:30S ribosomal protein S24e [Thermoplasmata archaeon]
MEIEILSKKKNDLLQRTELQFKISHPDSSSPNRESVRDAIAKKENASKELVIIDSMKTDFGLPNTKGFAKIYKSKDFAMDIERKHILIR